MLEETSETGATVSAPANTSADVRSTRSFWSVLVLIAVAALVWRILYVSVWGTVDPNGGDGFYYHAQANLLADGHGFANPFVWRDAHRVIPTATHPPLYPLALATSSVLGATSFLAHKIVSCLIGVAAVIVIALVGRRIGGPRAGLIAAVLAAAYPNLWVIDGLILSEGLFAVTIGLAVLAAYRFHDRPTSGNAFLVGAAIAAAALTRGEGIFLVVLLAVPLVVIAKHVSLERKLVLFAIVACSTGVLIAPWVVRNLTSFDEPVYLATGADDLLQAANCDPTYHGDLIGFWQFSCYTDVPGDESVRAAERRRLGLQYMSDHRGQVPTVVAARVGRIWEVYRPWQNARLATVEGRPLWAARAGLVAYWVLAPLAIYGLVVVRRRGTTLVPLLAQLALVTLTAITAYGVVRFRLPAEVVIVASAAVGLDALWTAARSRSAVSRERT
jgi:hypothetical protein